MADDVNGLLGPVPENFDPEKHYKVNLSRSVVVMGLPLNPANPPTLDGTTAQGIREVIIGAVEV